MYTDKLMTAYAEALIKYHQIKTRDEISVSLLVEESHLLRSLLVQHRNHLKRTLKHRENSSVLKDWLSKELLTVEDLLNRLDTKKKKK